HHLHHQDGGRELRHHGPGEGRAGLVHLLPGPIVSSFSNVRFNSVNPGLLKTSASAGIPGYADYYLYAEKLTLRKKGVTTQEVANAAAFLLSERASGINAQGIVLDAGMAVNYFDKE